MALEPLGSVMTAQVQPVQKTETVKNATGGTESTVQTNASIADAAVLTVNAPENRDNSGSQNGAREQGQAANEQLKQAVERINKSIDHSEVQFGIHEATNRVTIKVIDKDTHEVIKEFPPEKTLDMIAKVWEIAGLLVDEKR